MNIAHLLLGSAREFRDLPALARGTAPHLTYRDLWRKVSVMSMHLPAASAWRAAIASPSP